MSSLTNRLALAAILALPLCSAGAASAHTETIAVNSPLAAVLAGEIARSRGLSQTAWSAFMAAAKESGNARVAERAYETALSAGQKQQANQSLNLIRKLDPNSPRLAYERVLNEILEGKSGANHAAVLSKYIKDTRSPEIEFIKLGEHTSGMRDAKQRYALLREVARELPADVRTELLLGQAAVAAGEKKAALSHADKAAKLNSGSIQVLLGAAEVEFSVAPEEAQKRLRRFLSKHPDNLQIRIALVKAMVDHAEPSQIERELRHIDKLGKRTPKNLLMLGAICERAQLWKRAEQFYLEYIRRTEAGEDKSQLPDTGYLRLGMTKLLSGNQQEALTWLHKVERGDKYIPARVKEAEILASMGRINDSCTVLKSIRATSKKQRGEILGACAELLVHARRHAEAAEAMEMVFADDPDNTDAMLRASYYYEQADQFEKAVPLLKRYIKLRPEDPQGYNSLGYMWADRGINLEQSEKLIAKAMKLSQNQNPAVIDSMGWVEYRLGKLAQAEKFLRTATRMSTDKEIAMHLAQVLFARGKAAEARKILDKILESDPDNPDAKSMLKSNGF